MAQKKNNTKAAALKKDELKKQLPKRPAKAAYKKDESKEEKNESEIDPELYDVLHPKLKSQEGSDPGKDELPAKEKDELKEEKNELPVLKKGAHAYDPNCGCARCVKQTAKIAQDAIDKKAAEELNQKQFEESKQRIIDEFIAGLEAQDKIVMHFDADAKRVIGENYEYVKNNFGEVSDASLSKLLNRAVRYYLQIYIHNGK